MSICRQCGISTPGLNRLYCCNKCQCDFAYESYISRWKQGLVTGARGINTKNFSGHIVRYLLDKYKKQCARCSWSEKNVKTGFVPLEIDHIDGNSENNSEYNLILLCPNCHSLTKNYKNLNNGHGRLWRREKYGKM